MLKVMRARTCGAVLAALTLVGAVGAVQSQDLTGGHPVTFTLAVGGRLTEHDSGQPLRENSVVGFYRRVPSGYELVDYARVGSNGVYAGEIAWNASWPTMHLEESDWGCHYRQDTIAIDRRIRTYHHEHAIALRESECTRPHPMAIGAAMRVYDWLFRSVFRMERTMRSTPTVLYGVQGPGACDDQLCAPGTEPTATPREFADLEAIEGEIRERRESEPGFARALAERREIQARDGRTTRALLRLDGILAEERGTETEPAADTASIDAIPR